MTTVFYLLFSFAEWLALILLTFAMFKFQFRGFWGQILLTSASLCFFSHFVFQIVEQPVLATLLQPLALFLFLWQMFRIHTFYAALMTMYGYIGYTFIHYSLLFALTRFGVTLDDLVPNTQPAYIVQSSSIAIALIAAWICQHYRLGYTFIPDYEHAPFKMQGINIWLSVLITLGYLLIGASNYITFRQETPIPIFLLGFIVLGAFLYYAQRREHTYD